MVSRFSRYSKKPVVLTSDSLSGVLGLLACCVAKVLRGIGCVFMRFADMMMHGLLILALAIL